MNQHFKNSGYLTLGCGKIYHGTRGAFADVKGWDDYGQPKDTSKLAGTPPLSPAGQAHFDWGPNTTGDEAMHDYQTTEWIGKHLQTKRDQPMFLACGFTRPHLPWYVPQKYFDMHPLDKVQLPIVKEDDLDDVPEIGKRFAKPQGDHARVTKANEWKKGVQAYLAAITFSDAMVGRVLHSLEAGPNAGNTMVCLWSDHGWHLGEKLHWRKFTLWERSTRNILMFAAPGVTKTGAACDRTVSMMDVYPTLLDLAGLKAPGAQDGETLVPWLHNPAAGKKTPAVTTYLMGNHAIRTDAWRYIRYKDGTEELYDRAKDPNEWTNLAATPESASLKRDLARWLPKHDAPDAPGGRGNDPE
jgi:arylsulfatase A-like enzyme